MMLRPCDGYSVSLYLGNEDARSAHGGAQGLQGPLTKAYEVQKDRRVGRPRHRAGR